MPGATLPLRVIYHSERRLIERALDALEPLSRLITVVSAKLLRSLILYLPFCELGWLGLLWAS